MNDYIQDLMNIVTATNLLILLLIHTLNELFTNGTTDRIQRRLERKKERRNGVNVCRETCDDEMSR